MENDQPIPEVFISYSWDDEEHKRWVLNLAKKLGKRGVDAWIDRNHLHSGIAFSSIVEKKLEEAQKVIIVFTPNYKKKAEGKLGGVGHEYSIIKADFFDSQINTKKFIPILRKGTIKESIPSYMQQLLFTDFTNDDDFEASFDELLHGIFELPPEAPIEIGDPSDFFKKKKDYENTERANRERKAAVQIVDSAHEIQASASEITIEIPQTPIVTPTINEIPENETKKEESPPDNERSNTNVKEEQEELIPIAETIGISNEDPIHDNEKDSVKITLLGKRKWVIISLLVSVSLCAYLIINPPNKNSNYKSKSAADTPTNSTNNKAPITNKGGDSFHLNNARDTTNKNTIDPALQKKIDTPKNNTSHKKFEKRTIKSDKDKGKKVNVIARETHSHSKKLKNTEVAAPNQDAEFQK